MLHAWGNAEDQALQPLLKLALAEDLGSVGDLTSNSVIPAELVGQATLIARTPGVLAGVPLIAQVCREIDPRLKVTPHFTDGQALIKGDRIATITGPLRGLLSAERTILNFLQRLSGVASLTRQYVDAIKDYPCTVLDTRKTTPGWRVLEKFAVRCGGGRNHRMGLYDAVMIKDNHLAGLRHAGTPIATAINQARAAIGPKVMLEVEVENLPQLAEALSAHPDIVLLDNMTLDLLKQSVQLRNQTAPNVRLEASGGVNLQTIRAIAATGVDCISVGALTHSAPALDIALDYDE